MLNQHYTDLIEKDPANAAIIAREVFAGGAQEHDKELAREMVEGTNPYVNNSYGWAFEEYFSNNPQYSN